MKRKSKVAFGKLGLVLALTTAVFLGLVGVAGLRQLSQTVTASYTSDYAPATCVLSVTTSGTDNTSSTRSKLWWWDAVRGK